MNFDAQRIARIDESMLLPALAAATCLRQSDDATFLAERSSSSVTGEMETDGAEVLLAEQSSM
jgi:hypothetical protein